MTTMIAACPQHEQPAPALVEHSNNTDDDDEAWLHSSLDRMIMMAENELAALRVVWKRLSECDDEATKKANIKMSSGGSVASNTPTADPTESDFEDEEEWLMMEGVEAQLTRAAEVFEGQQQFVDADDSSESDDDDDYATEEGTDDEVDELFSQISAHTARRRSSTVPKGFRK